MTRPIEKKPKISVTGMGLVTGQGTSVKASMDQIFATPLAPAPPHQFSTDHPQAYPVFSLPEAIDHQISKNAQGLTLTARMGIAAAAQALKDAGINQDSLRGKRVGVCMGTTVGCTLNNDPFYAQYKQGKKPSLDPIVQFFSSNPAQAIAREFNLNGPIQTIVNACASGTDAIGIGTNWLEAGLCDLVIAGGTDELCKVTYNGFISLMITDDSPCKPFDANRKGLNLGEGAGVLILEPGGSSSLRNRKKCWISGYGSACDAYHLTAPRPDGRGLKAAIDQALDHSGLNPSDIGFINAHGTGTRDNDQVEMGVFNEKLPGTPFFSTKGYTGHTLGAAGAIEAVFTIDHLTSGRIPASCGFSQQDPKAKTSPTISHQPVNTHAAMSQSVAFGGNNSVLVFSLV